MEVEPNFKATEPCACTDERCPREGALVKQTFKDGSRHIKRCPCRQCLGRKSRRSGLSAQRKAAKGLGVPMVSSMRPSDEELYPGLLRMESKSGAIVKPMWTAYLKAEAQSETQRPIGDGRPFVMCARAQPESKDGLIVLRESKLSEVVYALALQLGMIDA